MLIIEREYHPGAGLAELWCSVDALELQVETWPNRNILLRVEDVSGREIVELVNPEPGMRIRVSSDETPRRVKLYTKEASGMFTMAASRIRVISEPVMVGQPKQEAQGISLTLGVDVAVGVATKVALGQFRAWRTGLVRVVGIVSADPTSLNFGLSSVYDSGGRIAHAVAQTGVIPHRATTFEYSLRDGTDGFLIPAVIAGRDYVLYVEHGSGAAKNFQTDLYIEPVALN